jgi:hypothetical protein
MTPSAFRAAVDAYAFGAPVPPLPQRSLLVGHAHGRRAASEPARLYALARAIDARALAFEWSYDELGPLMDDLRATGRLDVGALWRLPEAAEAFCGDGRFTAGHVALLERLHDERRLDQLILFDRLDATEPTRSDEMADRLATAWRRELPLVAVVGAAHLPTFARRLPELHAVDFTDGSERGTAVVPER